LSSQPATPTETARDTACQSSAQADSPAAKRTAIVLGIGMFFAFLAGAVPAPIKATWNQFEILIQLKSEPLPASPAKLSDHETEALPSMQPQQQAERLLERALNHYDGAIELIAKDVDTWYGRLDLQGQLSALLTTALNSNDLRVRAAALEIELAGYNLPKHPESVDILLDRIQNEPAARPWALWMLGVLGNRGVETHRAFITLMDHRHDPDEQTRYWAIEGLAMLGTDETLAPLLEALRGDPSPLVRERAGCGLAQSGMLSREQRMHAVSEMQRMSEDMTLDASTRTWASQALRDITGTQPL
jgi:HEAT repeat protein